jgi:hypothetical protein
MSLGVVLAALCGVGPVRAEEPNDYGKDASWLCRPGRHDACDVDLATTIVDADGRLRRETWKGGSNPLIDCFYVYPTVSTDPGPTAT